MPKLLSRSKHKEFESNSALQIRDQKERRAENTKKMEHNKNFAGLRNFRNLQNFAGCEIASARYCSSCSTVHSSYTVDFLRLLPFCYNFLFLPILSLVIDFGFFFFFFVISLVLSSI